MILRFRSGSGTEGVAFLLKNTQIFSFEKENRKKNISAAQKHLKNPGADFPILTRVCVAPLAIVVLMPQSLPAILMQQSHKETCCIQQWGWGSLSANGR